MGSRPSGRAPPRPVTLLRVKQNRHKPLLYGGPPLRDGKKSSPHPFEYLPVDQRRQVRQLASPIGHVNQDTGRAGWVMVEAAARPLSRGERSQAITTANHMTTCWL
jgi:hypothetical protein